ncbi:hypothetical protein NBO_238g0002 [Nosema bombycis CQ1]|uniref:Uncharacterized protein n=1 Tax=Nosema bombycis (strain CQ1 / CVCC 102059) TaxID=578461 RepID=R0M4W5_NOSB1|nr:hypothetical protein NBO_238g0002 [Nosema bombycis CQ1]|eukprot:EOB13039.1 hypothetical protein NBO_238g0002 [Nosema bombycis CQ1]
MEISNFFKLITKFIAAKNYIEVSDEEDVPLNAEKSVNAICLCDTTAVSNSQNDKMEDPSKTSESFSMFKTFISSDHDNQACANHLKNVLNSVFKKKIKNSNNTNYFYYMKKNVKMYECKNFMIVFFPYETSQKRFSRFLVYAILKNENWNLTNLWEHLYSKGTTSIMEYYNICRMKYVEMYIPIPETISLMNKYGLEDPKVLQGKIYLRNNVKRENYFFILTKKILDYFWPAEKIIRVSTPYLAFTCNQKDENKIQMFFMDNNENLMTV